MADTNDFNTQIIAEFRAKGGVVGGHFAGAPLLLLHHVGAKTGKERVSPVMYQAVGAGYAVFASKAGAPSNPDWYYNLVANPDVKIEVGTETKTVRARIAQGDERERIWSTQKTRFPTFASYEAKTSRQIPVVMLEP